MSRISRRAFVGQSAALAAAALPAVGLAKAGALPSLASARPFGANERLRVALLGVHGQGRVHASKWGAMKDAEVVAVCDPDSNVVADAIAAVEKKSGRKPEFVQ